MQLPNKNTIEYGKHIFVPNYDTEATALLNVFQPTALSSSLPVDIEEYIRSVMGLRIEYVDMSQLSLKGEEPLGFITYGDVNIEIKDAQPCHSNRRIRKVFKRGTIVLSQELLRPENIFHRRETLAHELGHWVNYISQMNAPRQAITKPDYEDQEEDEECLYVQFLLEEFQAESMGSAILMPREPFVNAFRNQMTAYDIYDDVLDLSRYWDIGVKICVNLSKVYQVTEQYVRFRAVRCKLATMEIVA